MFGLGPKRSRTSRTVAFRSRTSVWSRVTTALTDRSVLLRLGVCLAAMLLLLIAVKSWKAPFPYREGDRPAHGLAAKIAFQRIDHEKTAQARRAAEDQAPFVFRNRSELLDPLPQKLRASLLSLAAAESLEAVPADVALSFGLVPDPKADESIAPFRGASANERFTALREAVTAGNPAATQQRIDDIIDDFQKFLTPLRTLGVIDPRDVREKKIRAESSLRITTTDEPPELISEVFLPQLQLSVRLSEGGDLGKSWLSYPAIPESIRAALSYWIIHDSPFTLRYDDVRTHQMKSEAGNAIDMVIDAYGIGDQLVGPGETVGPTHIELLKAEYEAAERSIGFTARLSRSAVVFFMLLVLAVLTGYYIVRYEPQLSRSLSRLTVYLAVIVVAAAAGRMLSFWYRADVIPLVAAVMIFAIAYNQVLASLTGFTLAMILTLSTTTRLDQFVELVSTAAMAAIPLSRVASRSALIKVGFYAGVTYFFTSCAIDILQSQTLGEVFANKSLLAQASWGFGWCLATGYVVAGSLPFVESTFGVVTDISLLELSDPSHPLLQELVRRAPGTYNHSIAVASVAEAAAEAIDANGLLVRVGAYFHDIGKMMKPQYFIENVQAGTESRHNQLAPAMSTLIIIGHVKDGVDLAEQHNLPRALIDFIEQHHGTTLVEYFYHAATRQAELDPDHGHDAEESAYRYPGPKPQTREAGVLMLADAVESASRTLNDPTPKRIETLVHNLTMKRLLDGQFEECSLKLSEIRTIEKSLIKSLIAIYHGRIRYPDASTSEVRTA